VDEVMVIPFLYTGRLKFEVFNGQPELQSVPDPELRTHAAGFASPLYVRDSATLACGP
jgi:hypothetical protein